MDDGDSLPIEKFKTDLNKRFSFGDRYNRLLNEDTDAFVKRILGNKTILNHGAFELNEFKNSIVSFGIYKFEDSSIIVGLILEPINSNREYRLSKILEFSSGCGSEPKIESVFLHDIEGNSFGKKLIIHSSYSCGRHGTSNHVFIYNGLVKNNKLILKKHLSERCDYSEVKIDGDWDFDMGDENVERRYNKCSLSDFNAIKNILDNTENK